MLQPQGAGARDPLQQTEQGAQVTRPTWLSMLRQVL